MLVLCCCILSTLTQYFMMTRAAPQSQSSTLHLHITSSFFFIFIFLHLSYVLRQGFIYQSNKFHTTPSARFYYELCSNVSFIQCLNLLSSFHHYYQLTIFDGGTKVEG